ncbi:MAG: hypothetical protein KA271_07325 [Propionivibrio sp.]|nr:hypothetical protein [Propionivibrio sp.]
MENPGEVVTTSERLWSEEVAIASAGDPLSSLDHCRQPGYEFSNGRKFDSGLGSYEPTATLP